jgi:hypothetical protein
MSEICDDEHLSVWLATNRVAEDGLGVVRGGPERRLPALGRRPGGGAPTGAIRGGGGGAGAAGEAHRHRRGRREGVRPLTSGGHDLDGEVDYRWIQRVGRSLLFKLSFFFF